MATPAQKWALVTGASSGIGEECARELAAKGYSLALVARSEAKLRTLATELESTSSVATEVIVSDLSQPGAATAVARQLAGQSIALDVLVNNAGFGGRGAFVESDWDRELAMIQLNVIALVELTKRILPGMVAQRSGYVLNVASTAAFQPGPFMAVYFATKAFVLSFSEAVNEELRGSGVSVTTLCPGPTESGFFDAAKMKGSKLFMRNIPSSREVAKAGLAAMFARRRTLVHGFTNRVGTFFACLLPKGLVLGTTRKLVE